MGEYAARAVERAMKIQEVILRTLSRQILWMQAAEILGISDRGMRRRRRRYENHGYDGLFERRTKRPSPKKVPLAEVEKVLRLYRERYFDFNVRHFVKKLHEVNSEFNEQVHESCDRNCGRDNLTVTERNQLSPTFRPRGTRVVLIYQWLADYTCGLKILGLARGVRVRFPPSAQMESMIGTNSIPPQKRACCS